MALSHCGTLSGETLPSTLGTVKSSPVGAGRGPHSLSLALLATVLRKGRTETVRPWRCETTYRLRACPECSRVLFTLVLILRGPLPNGCPHSQDGFSGHYKILPGV